MPNILCGCCEERLLDVIVYEYECEQGHIHTDTHFVCPDCDIINVNEVYWRQAYRLA